MAPLDVGAQSDGCGWLFLSHDLAAEEYAARDGFARREMEN